MGCDIHSHVESKSTSESWMHVKGRFVDGDEPFAWRSYALFGWLAGVRNYSDVTPISEPRGFPADPSEETAEDFKEWGSDAHTPSWLTVDELAAFDYDALVEDRRVTRQVAPNGYDGGCTAEPGGGEMTTYRQLFGESFFADLAGLQALNEKAPTRVVFWFDN